MRTGQLIGSTAAPIVPQRTDIIDLATGAGAYSLNPDNPNYVNQTAADIRDVGLNTYGGILGAVQDTQDFGYQTANQIQNLGEDAMNDIAGYGVKQGKNLQNLGQQAAGAIADAGTGAASAITGAAKAGQGAITGATNTSANQLLAAGQAGQGALTQFGANQANAFNQAGAGALGQLGAYGQAQGSALGALGAGAAQAAAQQGQAAAALGAQQGAALGQQAAFTGGNVAAGALGQSAAINQFAGQQQAAAQAAQNRQFAAPNFDAANAILSQAGATAQQLTGLEATEGPSAAQAQLQTGLNAAQQSNLAMARSGRGFGGSTSALAQAATQNAQAGQQAANTAAALRAQETAAWKQRAAANLGAAAGLQSQLGQQAQSQTQFAGQLGLQQQALADQTSLGYGQQALGALGDAGNLAMQGGLGGGQLALQGGQAGANLAMQGALGGGQLGLAGSQLQGQLASQGANLGMQGLQSGQQLNLQAMQAGSDANLQALSSGYGMGLQSAGMASDARMQGTLASAGMGLQGAGMAGDVGLQSAMGAGQLAADTYGQGAQLGLGAMETGYGMNLGAQQTAGNMGMQAAGQTGALLSAGQQAYNTGIGMENQLYQQEADRQRLRVQDYLTKYGIDKGVAIQQQGMDNQMLGAGLSTAAAMLPLLMAASDRDAKQDIKPADEIRLPSIGGGGGAERAAASAPGGPAYDAAMGSAAAAEKKAAMLQSMVGALGAGGQAFGNALMQPVGGNPYMFNPIAQQYLASDKNSKMRIAQLEDQVSLMGGNPAESSEMMPLVYDQRDKIYRPYDPEQDEGFARGGGSDSPWSVPDPLGYGAIAALDDAQRRQGGQVTMPSPRGEAARDMLEKTPAYSFQYKEPERFGEGQQVGLMAQDLMKSPLGRSMVKKSPDGTLLVDSSKVAMATAAATANMQRDIEKLKQAGGLENFDRNALDDAYARDMAYQGLY